MIIKFLFSFILSFSFLFSMSEPVSKEFLFKKYNYQNNQIPIEKISVLDILSSTNLYKSVVGFENDLLELLGKKTGLKFQKHYGAWNENLKAFHPMDNVL